MRGLGLLLLLCGCGASRVDSPRPLPLVEQPARDVPIPLTTLGADAASRDWIELEVPEGARVLSFGQDVSSSRETWTFAEIGARRVLRIRFEKEGKVAHVAYAGAIVKNEIDLRLVEVVGTPRFAPEHFVATCRRDAVCEEGKPAHRADALMCQFAGNEDGVSEVAFFAPGKGIDFVVGSCPPRYREVQRYPMAPPTP